MCDFSLAGIMDKGLIWYRFDNKRQKISILIDDEKNG